MAISNRTSCVVSCVMLAIICKFGFGNAECIAEEAPRVSVLQAQSLLDAKKRAQSGDAALAPAFKKLTREADRALEGSSYSVVNKEILRPAATGTIT